MPSRESTERTSDELGESRTPDRVAGALEAAEQREVQEAARVAAAKSIAAISEPQD